MIHLDASAKVGAGAHRGVYRHPEHSNRCIKVALPGQEKDTARENRQYRHLQRRGISWDMISRYYGDVKTNLGPASVYELILDDDREISRTLEHYLSTPEEADTLCESLAQALYALKDYIFRQRIITMLLKPKNIVCVRSPAGITRMVVIDNVANNDFIPICNYNRFLARRKVTMKWKVFEERMLQRYESNKALQAMLAHVASESITEGTADRSAPNQRRRAWNS